VFYFDSFSTLLLNIKICKHTSHCCQGVSDSSVIEQSATGRERLIKASKRILKGDICKQDHCLMNDARAVIEVLENVSMKRSLKESQSHSSSASMNFNHSSVSFSAASALAQLHSGEGGGDQHDVEQQEEEEIDLSGAKVEYGPDEMLTFMSEALANNPKIMLKLQYRRFQLAQVLENIEEATRARDNPNLQYVRVSFYQYLLDFMATSSSSSPPLSLSLALFFS
jgi:hypothetical protein